MNKTIDDIIREKAEGYGNTGSFQGWLKLPLGESKFGNTMRNYSDGFKDGAEWCRGFMEWASENEWNYKGEHQIWYKKEGDGFDTCFTTELQQLYITHLNGMGK